MRSRGAAAAGLSILAMAYGAALLVAVAVAPALDGESLLEHGGPWSLAIFAQPLVASAVVWSLLRRRCHAGGDGVTAAAWSLATVYLVYSVLGGFSIAAGALPAAVLMLLAVAVTPRGAPA